MEHLENRAVFSRQQNPCGTVVLRVQGVLPRERSGIVFFHHIKAGTILVLVGDVNQLPGVGPGNVFRELVMCGVIPITVLDMVFRQAENSRIAMNAHRMQENNAMLDYGPHLSSKGVMPV